MYNDAMNFTITFKKWGNSLGIRLPSALAREMRLVDGTAAEMTVEDGQIHIRPQVSHGGPRRQRRALSFYEQRARKLGLANLIQAVEVMPDDAPRRLENL
jgi:antitoxin component of MazEF toxin-antitoxin module